MFLEKTTVLPTDDADLAVRMFRQVVFEEPRVVMVVLGAGAEAETFATRADRLAGTLDEPRWVLWARNPDDVKDEIAELKGSAALKRGLIRSRGFSLALDDEVRDVIRASEPVPSLTRVFEAYARAEA